MLKIEQVAIHSLKPNKRNARTHPAKQIRQIADSMKAFGFLVPILIDEDKVILAGHGRYAAAKLLELTEVPVIRVSNLSEVQKRALALADNKIAQNAGWDRQTLAVELPELSDLLIPERLDISITGFRPVEIDQIAVDLEDDSSDPVDGFDADWLALAPVSSLADIWQLGDHRLLCGDARKPATVNQLMGRHRAAMAFLDPPYNLRIKGTVGRGRIKHDEFAMASGELSRGDFVAFLIDSLGVAASVCQDGAIHFVCMDWRHVGELFEAAQAVYGATLNLAVWVKSNAGQGSFYRNQHELVGVFRVGHEPHLNNIELGRHGRNRPNVWHYAGANTFRTGRMEDLASHPTVKPTALVSDAIKDCTRRGDIVLDTFAGSGATILAAERVGRRAFAVEIEPRFVDVAIRRWQQFTCRDAIHLKTGQCFDDIVARSAGEVKSHSISPVRRRRRA
jgi:DNA modification methylase